MPYKSTKEIKDKVNGADKLSERKLSQFMQVFNSCEESGSDESSCYAQAWGVVNKTSSVDPKELETGIEVEMEHTDDRETAKQIALDHLAEIPDYYYHLLKMEKEVKEDKLHKQVSSEINKIAKLLQSSMGIRKKSKSMFKEPELAFELKKYKNFTGIIKTDWYQGYVKNATFTLAVRYIHWEKGIWDGGHFWGNWRGGIFKSGVFENGSWDKGTFAGGTWEMGTFNAGIFKKGLWKHGNFRGGVFKGTWKSGDWFGGTFKGTWKGGKWYDDKNPHPNER